MIRFRHSMPGAILALALAASSPALALDPGAQRGFNFARTNCAKCHAIGAIGDSPLSEAPPFRTLHLRYPVEDLAESFAEGIRTGHPSMPEWRLDAAEINDLIAYLKTL
jgi:cytochrome c